MSEYEVTLNHKVKILPIFITVLWMQENLYKKCDQMCKVYKVTKHVGEIHANIETAPFIISVHSCVNT